MLMCYVEFQFLNELTLYSKSINNNLFLWMYVTNTFSSQDVI